MLLSLAVSVVAGGIAGLGVRIAHTRYKERKTRQRLRRGLYEEIRTMSDDINNAAHILDSMSPESEVVRIPTDTLVTTTYEATAENIGILTDMEVDAIVEFYSLCFQTQKAMSSVGQPTERDASNVLKLRQLMINLQGQMVRTMRILEDNLDVEQSSVRNFTPIQFDESDSYIGLEEVAFEHQTER